MKKAPRNLLLVASESTGTTGGKAISTLSLTRVVAVGIVEFDLLWLFPGTVQCTSSFFLLVRFYPSPLWSRLQKFPLDFKQKGTRLLACLPLLCLPLLLSPLPLLLLLLLPLFRFGFGFFSV